MPMRNLLLIRGTGQDAHDADYGHLRYRCNRTFFRKTERFWASAPDTFERLNVVNSVIYFTAFFLPRPQDWGPNNERPTADERS